MVGFYEYGTKEKLALTFCGNRDFGADESTFHKLKENKQQAHTVANFWFT